MARLIFEIHAGAPRREMPIKGSPAGLHKLRIVRIEDGAVTTGEPIFCDGIEEARSHLPEGMARWTAGPSDPDTLVEAWE